MIVWDGAQKNDCVGWGPEVVFRQRTWTLRHPVHHTMVRTVCKVRWGVNTWWELAVYWTCNLPLLFDTLGMPQSVGRTV